MNRFLKGAMILTVAGVVVKIIGAFSKVILARILGGEGIGLYQMAYPIYQIIVSIATAGLPVAISIMVADKLANDDARGVRNIFRVSLALLTVLGVVFGIGMYISTPWLLSESGPITDTRAYYAILALVPAIPVVTVLSCFRGYFQGFQDMMPTGVSQVFEQTFRVTAMVALAYWLMADGLPYAAAGATFATLPGVTAGLVILLYFYYRRSPVRQRLAAMQNEAAPEESVVSIMKRLIVLAVPVSMANIMMPIVSGIDLGVVPQRLLEAGYTVREATTLFGYLTGMATSLVNLPIILTTSLAASLVPAVSEAYAKKDGEEIRRRTHMAMKIASLITVPAFVGLCVLATPVASLLYAAPQAGGPIAVMSLSIFLLGMQQVTTAVLQGLGHTAIPMVNLVICTVLKIPLSWYLTAQPDWGINGAAWSTNIDFGLAAALNMIFVYRYIQYRLPVILMMKILCSALAMGGAAAVIYYMAVTLAGNGVSVMISIIGAVAVYGGTLLLTKAVEYNDLYHMPFIGKRMRKKEEI